MGNENVEANKSKCDSSPCNSDFGTIVDKNKSKNENEKLFTTTMPMTLSYAKGGGRDGKATHEHITAGGKFSNLWFN